MKPAFHLVFQFVLLTTLTLLPVLVRSQTPDPSIKNAFAAGNESSFPFEFRQGMIFVPVRLDGSNQLSFVLDTGSTRMLVDRTLAKPLGLKITDRGHCRALGPAGPQLSSFRISASLCPDWRVQDTNSPLPTFSRSRPASE